jgi:hypothetical protein
MPRVILLRQDGEAATRKAVFVDDIHPTGRDPPGKEVTLKACKQLKSGMNTRGNQADDAKSRKPTTTPGAWNGCIMHTDTPFPRKSTTKKKWDRFRDGLQWVAETSEHSDTISTAELRRLAGLGVNVTDVYSDARPYLKGFFNAIEAFRGDRDLDGWRLQEAMEDALYLEAKDAPTSVSQAGYPLETRITNELKEHVRALRVLFTGEDPLAVPVRPTDAGKIRYVIGDASAEGFGFSTQYPDGTLETRDGLWADEFAQGGSNLREAQNQVNQLLADVRSGKHDGCEVWGIADNEVWSLVWNKGLSSARHLFNLVLELRVECRKHEIYYRSLHISGERMIATGIDGRSRGNYDLGISLGYDVRTFIPLYRSAWEVAGRSLEEWCISWMGEDFAPPLTSEGWFEEGHRPGVHIWAPAPAAGLIALKEMERSRLKRPYTTTHVVMIPRLLYQEEWRSRFEKSVDVWFSFYPGSVWPNSAFEPLMMGIRFPFARSYPWEVKQEREQVVGIGRALSKLSRDSHIRVGDYLRKFWRNPRAFPTV